MLNFKGKSILIMGGTGSIGSKITEQLLSFGLDRLTIFSRDESKYQYLWRRKQDPGLVLCGRFRGRPGAMSGIS